LTKRRQVLRLVETGRAVDHVADAEATARAIARLRKKIYRSIDEIDQ